MSFKDKMLKAQAQLQTQYEESINTTKDSGGGSFGSIFKRTGDALHGLSMYKLETRTHWIEIVPFFAGTQHPKAQKGSLVYHVDLWVHRDIGLSNDHFVCQRLNWETPDPICVWINSNKPVTEVYKKVAPKRRCVYFIFDRYNPDEGLQILEVSHFFFQQHLDGIMKDPRGGPPVNFAHPTEGKSIIFEISKSGSYTTNDGRKMDAKKAIGFRFVDRDEPVPDSIFESVFSLDEAIEMYPDTNKQRQAVGSDDDMGGNEETTPEDETYDEDETEEETYDEEEEDLEEEDDSIEASLEGLTRSELKKLIKEYDLDIKVYKNWSDEKIKEEIIACYGTEEEDPEEEVEVEVEEEVASDECPHGYEFGEDLEQYPECQNCVNWDPCSEAMETQEDEPEPEPKPKPKPKTKAKAKRKSPPKLRKK